MRVEHWVYTLPLRLRSIFRRERVEHDLDEELQYHVDRQTEEYVRRGMSNEAARRQAMLGMDGLAQHKEECRDARHVNAIENLVRDIRFAARVLSKAPGFTVIAVVTLALAIGANAVVFGILDALILRPLNLPHGDRVYALQHGRDNTPAESYPDYLDLRDRNRSFDGLAAFSVTLAALNSADSPARVWAYEVTGNYFDVLGIKPYVGRFFSGADERGPDSAPFVVLTYAYWHAHFHDDRGIVGRTVEINKHPFTITGVAPPGFQGTLLMLSPDVFVPLVNTEQLEGVSTLGSNVLNSRGTRNIAMAIGRLKPGVTASQAIADLSTIGSYLDKTYPQTDGDMRFTLAKPGLFGDYLGRPVTAFLTALMFLAISILIAACANLGSLFAARAGDRAREVAVRLALGATRTRILRQLLSEALLISLAGGAIGLALSVVLLRALSTWQPIPQFPIRILVAPNPSVYVMALFLAIVSGLLFGAVPIRQVQRTDAYQVIKSGGVSLAGRRLGFRDILVAVQIAICAVLVTSSMVALRGLARSLHSDFGFEPRNAMLLNTNLEMVGYRGDEVAAMQRRLLTEISSIPAVSSAGLIDRLPLSGDWMETNVFTDDTVDRKPANAAAVIALYSASPDYFQAANTRLVAGRTFTQYDDKTNPRVAIVNREFAKKVFGAESKAPGGYFKRRDGTRIQVVGIIEDGKYKGLTEDPQPVAFLPLTQAPASDTWLVVRSRAAPQALASAIRERVRRIDAGLPVYMQTWNEGLDLALFPSVMATASLGILGILGAMLSVTGIFGIAAYSVSKRMRELGIRMALGARQKEVLGAALGRALKLLAFGSAAGIVLGVLASRVLAFIVYEASPRDPLVLAGVIVAMLALGVIAAWIPAQRALSLNPSSLLRQE